MADGSCCFFGNRVVSGVEEVWERMWKKKVTPRFGDVDGLRHINNCLLPQWFELGREPMFRLFNPEVTFDPWTLIMARIGVDFTAQMRLGADVEIRTWIKKIGRSSVTVYQEAWQNGEMGAKGEAVIVHYDFAEEKSKPIPDPIRAELEKHLLPDDATPVRTRSGRFPEIPEK